MLSLEDLSFEFTDEELNPFIEVVQDDKPQAQEWVSNITEEIDYMIPFPGLARDIQQWIISTSIKVQPALAFAATLSVLSTAYGRNYNMQGIKGNFMSLCLAESGEGKDWPLKSCQRILEAVGMGHHVYGDMASGAALVDAINETPSALLQIDEAGHYFASINSKTSNQFSREIMPIITKCATSGSDYYLDKKRKGQDARKITEPNLSVFGMSTERQIIDSLKSSEVSDGSLARFMVIFGLNDVPITQNRASNATVPESIKRRLELIKGGQFMLKSKEVIPSKEYIERKEELEHYFNGLAIAIGRQTGDKALFKPFYHRLAVRSVSMSLLIDQCQDMMVLEWCARIVQKSCEVFIKKFCHLAADNENEKYVKVIERAIKEAGKQGITKEKFYDKTRCVESGLKKRVLADLFDSNKIFTEETTSERAKKPTTTYFWRK